MADAAGRPEVELADARAAGNPSPAALRLLFETAPADGTPALRVLKCRGGNPPTQAIPLRDAMAGAPAHDTDVVVSFPSASPACRYTQARWPSPVSTT